MKLLRSSPPPMLCRPPACPPEPAHESNCLHAARHRRDDVQAAADKQLKTIFENNRRWVREEVKKDKDYFNRMASGQSPQILWIGCSDSRVPANRLRPRCR